jgi:hypothetical protein
MTWVFESEGARKPQLTLRSQNRPGRIWGPFTVPSGNPTGFGITCKQDEYICFGAWWPNDNDHPLLEWGLGSPARADAGCANCCYHCNGRETQLLSLFGPYDPHGVARYQGEGSGDRAHCRPTDVAGQPAVDKWVCE